MLQLDGDNAPLGDDRVPLGDDDVPLGDDGVPLGDGFRVRVVTSDAVPGEWSQVVTHLVL